MPVFQGVAPWHTILTSSCVILLWDSATAHSPVALLALALAYCFVNVLTLSCLGFLWFDTHPYYLLNPYVHLYYLQSISITKDRHYPKYFILCVV